MSCQCTATCTLNPGFRSPRFDSEVRFMVCPLGSTFVLSCPLFHVFIFLSLLRAQVHIRLNLSLLPPLGEACV